ncbi:MAG TPA: tRNA (N(6)-L-threonylcarbamoyladenosine(37)-C(2))-methylthiotransferase [Nitrososphaera sp.]|nr:tRNA (N(6)-L-threonylcarbamoyladenosine(37)-C(2))-methylthiotransferase [Nitrososphaera sp.]
MTYTMFRGSLKPSIIETIPMITRTKPKVWIEAYGCSANMADSEMISGLLKDAGYEIANTKSESSLNLIVTCSVKDTTEHKMMSRIRTMVKSGKPLVIAGCLPKADKLKIESSSPSASLIGPNSIDKAPDAVRSALSGGRLVALKDSPRDKVNIPRIRLNPVVSIVEIANGCMSECTFCQTKIAKGWLRSYRIGDIVRQIKADIQSGCKEVWLSSTDNGCYGRDMDSNLVDLLQECCSIEGSFKIRVGMMNPMYLPEILDRMVCLFSENDKLFKFLHIPVQSGSDRVLRKMKRGHTSKIFIDAVQAFRERIPEMTISTDIIVGFPSETDDDFKQTVDLLERTQPDVVNISRYAARPGTKASQWREMKVSSQISKKRSEYLHTLTRRIAKKRNSLWQEWQGQIVVDEVGKVIQGRNYAYKPVVITSTQNVVDNRILLGDTVSVKICDFSNFSLKANVV